MSEKYTPFTFINSINSGQKGKNLLNDCKADNSTEPNDPSSIDKAYIPFIVNRGLSYFSDTILLANEMNQNSHLPQRMQYDFLKNAVSPREKVQKGGRRKQ